VHLTDSLNPRAPARTPRLLGEGHIGLQAFGRIVNHPRLRHLPFFLETPNELPGYAREIALLRGMAAK
jgi:deoxyribonuclease-4